MTTVDDLNDVIAETVDSLSHLHPAVFEHFLRWELDTLIVVGMPVEIEEDGITKIAEVVGCVIDTDGRGISVSVRAWVPPDVR